MLLYAVVQPWLSLSQSSSPWNFVICLTILHHSSASWTASSTTGYRLDTESAEDVQKTTRPLFFLSPWKTALPTTFSDITHFSNLIFILHMRHKYREQKAPLITQYGLDALPLRLYKSVEVGNRMVSAFMIEAQDVVVGSA